MGTKCALDISVLIQVKITNFGDYAATLVIGKILDEPTNKLLIGIQK